MDDRTLNLYLSRILSGFYVFHFGDKLFKLLYPNIDIKYQSEIYAQKIYEDNKYNEWIKQSEILYVLIDLGLWSMDGDKKLKKIEDDIDNSKVELFKNFLNPTKQKTIRKKLTQQKKQYDYLYSVRYSLDHITLEGYCHSLKNDYILTKSLFDHDGNLVFNDNNGPSDYFLLKNISSYIAQSSLEISTFKSIARSNIWKNYWSANKNNLFDKPVVNWTDEQKTLVVLTRMYDSVYEHPESPPDIVIEDDDMLDGWMIIQKRESEKSKNKKRNEQFLPDKIKNSQEVFLMANSKEEAQNIYNMNDHQGIGIIKERNQIISQNNQITEQNLPDIKRDIILQSNEKRKQMRKT